MIPMRSLAILAMAAVLLLGWAGPARCQGYAPSEAAARMQTADGLAVQLYATEPRVRQPILVKFDDRGRLWTIQYLQYPTPAGLKRVQMDRWFRAAYDRVPEPPPQGPRGDDRITVCDDTDGDGRADRFHDFVTGLNLCTGLEFGHDGVFVLQVPYLLFYPDRDGDGVADGNPRVLLTGFGMEDAQSLVNHLTLGPDGWLYGVTGSTSTNLVRGIEFQQAVWRYHTPTKRFELFCEGGGNLFGLTFDSDGNLIYSSNGTDLAYHAVQGGYYRKNFGKHGPLHHPYTYGFFEHLPADRLAAGPKPGGTVYLGNSLPDRFRGAFCSCDYLQHGASWWRLVPTGSTFAAHYGGTLFDSRDTWCCPTDLCQGPDGALYVSDFYDRRTAHPDPNAEWDRSNGRIYRIAPPATRPVRGLDLARKTSRELIELLRHPNGWYAARARVLLAGRRDRSTWPALAALARQTEDHRLALQGLWGLYVSGGFDDAVAADLLHHPYEYVRAWTVRLLGDAGKVSSALGTRFAAMAGDDTSVIVRSQLAATARRLPGDSALPIVEQLLRRGLDRDDPYVPLLLWWALEAKVRTDPDRLLAFFTSPAAWADGAMRTHALRLVRRFAAEGTRASYGCCTRLLAAVPTAYRPAALEALERGLAERALVLGGMGMAGLYSSIAVPEKTKPAPARHYEPLTAELRDYITAGWREAPGDLIPVRLALRAGLADAVPPLLAEVTNPRTSAARRRALLDLLAELGSPACVPAALTALADGNLLEVRLAALEVVAQHGGESATGTLLALYRTALPALRARLREVLLARPESARAFLEAVDRNEITSTEVPVEALRTVALHGNAKLVELVRKHWGNIQAGSSEEKLAELRRVLNDLHAGAGDADRGKVLFRQHCAVCHKMFGEGGEVGPELTSIARNDTTALLASIVDPSAVIRTPYLQYAAVTTGGRVVAGVIAAQDGAGVTLIDALGKRTTLPRESIQELRELPASIMPENLLKPLRPQEVRDLFRFLQSPAPAGNAPQAKSRQ